MNEEQFRELVAFLGLGDRADGDEVLEKVKALAGIVQMIGDGDDESRAAMLAASAQLSHITGETTMGGVVVVVRQWAKDRAEHAQALETERQQRQALELGEYRKLTAQLVKVGAEIPATAWEDDKGTQPVARILAEPLTSLRKRVARLSAANGGHRIVAAKTDADLTQRELQQLEAKNIDPAKYAKIKNRMRGQRTGTEG